MARHNAKGTESLEQVISFKVNGDVTEKLLENGADLPVPEGFSPLSLHQIARAFMIKGLEAHIKAKKEEEK